MAVHADLCPGEKNTKQAPAFGTALEGERCANLFRRWLFFFNRCKGDGITSGSGFRFCEGCANHYNICELCGKPFTDTHPKSEDGL